MESVPLPVAQIGHGNADVAGKYEAVCASVKLDVPWHECGPKINQIERFDSTLTLYRNNVRVDRRDKTTFLIKIKMNNMQLQQGGKVR